MKWEDREDDRPPRRRPGAPGLLDTAAYTAGNLEVGAIFDRDGRLWVVLLLLRGSERLSVACRKYGWREQHRLFTLALDARIRRYWPTAR